MQGHMQYQYNPNIHYYLFQKKRQHHLMCQNNKLFAFPPYRKGEYYPKHRESLKRCWPEYM